MIDPPGGVTATIYLCTTIARRLIRDLPERRSEADRFCALFGLAPDGVYQADRVTPIAGALLPHRFTLATHRIARRQFGRSAVCFLLHFP